MLAITIAIAIGIALPMETAINSRLQGVLKSPYFASFMSFFMGTILLTILLRITGHSLIIAPHFIASQPWWIWLGGVLAVVYLTGNILLFPKLGGIQTVLMPILGEILMGLLIDGFGWFASTRYPITWLRLVGALLMISGIVCAVVLPDRSRKSTYQRSADHPNRGRGAWQLLGIVFGGFAACQTAVNGHLGYLLHSPIQGAYVSFLIGTVLLLITVLIQNHGLRLPVGAISRHPWWIWFGGFIGALFVLGNVYLVPIIGTGLTVVIVLFGQIIGGLVVDQFGLFGAKRNPIVFLQIVGLLIMIVGVLLIKIF
ncbi:DMT family transporter [Furfurilactobacillus entadae]|uniref:DMT family transporter n=1 Tax=Furfurilactobacillus entadae TaxID=2922307 RepID=UPI0035ECE715